MTCSGASISQPAEWQTLNDCGASLLLPWCEAEGRFDGEFMSPGAAVCITARDDAKGVLSRFQAIGVLQVVVAGVFDDRGIDFARLFSLEVDIRSSETTEGRGVPQEAEEIKNLKRE